MPLFTNNLYSPWQRGFSPAQFYLANRKQQLDRAKFGEDIRRYEEDPEEIGGGYKYFRGTIYREGEKPGRWKQFDPVEWEGNLLIPQISPEGKLELVRVPPIKPGVNVTTNVGAGPDEFQKNVMKKLGTEVGDSIAKRDNYAQEAVNQNNQLGFVKSAIAQGAKTGFGEEAILGLKSFAQTIGIGENVTGDISGQEVIRKISNEMALRLRNPESGLGLTGNTSNKDLAFLKASVVGLNRTEKGNLLIISAMERMNKLKVAVADEQWRIIKNNKGDVPRDINQQLMRFVDRYEFWTPKERVAMKKLSKPIAETGEYEGRPVVRFEGETEWEYAN